MNEVTDELVYTNPRRDTRQDLVDAVLQRMRDSGDMAEIEPILDYIIPDKELNISSEDEEELTDYRFSVAPDLDFGCEGIYLTVRLKGVFDDSGRHGLCLAVAKTLETDLDACRLMGSLGGAFLYHTTQYVNENIHRYTPARELEREYRRKKMKEASK